VGIAGQKLHGQPVPLALQPGAHHPAVVRRQVVPS
jgi:hypothetical protein